MKTMRQAMAQGRAETDQAWAKLETALKALGPHYCRLLLLGPFSERDPKKFKENVQSMGDLEIRLLMAHLRCAVAEISLKIGASLGCEDSTNEIDC